MDDFIAHKRSTDDEIQGLQAHLLEVGELASGFAAKIGLADQGRILGLLHDFGKYSQQFQHYIKSATGIIDQDDEAWVDSTLSKGKIDHSTAGAQYVWKKLSVIGTKVGQGELCGQILALCIASHHSGLIDCLNEEGYDNFTHRITKKDDKTHLQEAMASADAELKQQADNLLTASLLSQMFYVIQQCIKKPKAGEILTLEDAFTLGVLTRFLFSCLIDADRLNSAEFEYPQRKTQRQEKRGYFNWQIAIDRLNQKLDTFTLNNPIDAIRRDISDVCYKRAFDVQGIYTLTVPTGGGKTLASLRYALQHAQQHQLDRIIYIIPYTSIIEQNADAVRKIIERQGDTFPWILEHHSNLEPEQQTWHSKLSSENWDAPIVFTTMVQFLEALFSGGTRSVRRMHQLAKSVLIFDEIQTLPINCTHLFCNSLNFLMENAKTTAVLCTATQPVLNKLPVSKYGELRFANNAEIVSDKAQLFESLKRVDVINRCKAGGWSKDEIVELVTQRFNESLSCLVIVNTKNWAKDIFVECQSHIGPGDLFHLSTNQCAAHRKQLLTTIRERLEQKLPVLCISTQLIEAGVDVDFCNVIRFLAGLDSIAQASGRCNRNGKLKNSQGGFIQGQVDIINPSAESISSLVDIVEGQEKSKRVFSEFNSDAILSPEAIDQYFKYFFFDRKEAMVYPLESGDCLLNILANNDNNNGSGPKSPRSSKARVQKGKVPWLQQSFMAAGKAFKAIDAPTHSLIVQYGKGKDLVIALCGVNKKFNAAEFYGNLKKAQQYSVNVFPNVWESLIEENAVYEIQEGEGIYYLDERYYSEAFGLTINTVTTQNDLAVF